MEVFMHVTGSEAQGYFPTVVTRIFILIHNKTSFLLFSSQISKSIFDRVNSLKNETNSIYVSLIVLQNDDLNNKVNEINSPLLNMCQQQNITIINHTNIINLSKHLNQVSFI